MSKVENLQPPNDGSQPHQHDSGRSLEFFPPPDYKDISDSFAREFQRAADGEPTSTVSYLRHVFPSEPVVHRGVIQGIVIGGTNFETALADASERGIVIRPGTRTQVKLPNLNSRNTLSTFLAEYLDHEAQAVGINFAFPLDPKQGPYGIDGVLRYGTKEHALVGLVGKPIGETLKEDTGLMIPVAVANDTICLGDNGLVVGTGFNIAFGGINLEAGGFNQFTPTPELEEIDAASPTRRQNRYEKMFSGPYLPHHFNLIAARHGIPANQVTRGEQVTKLAEGNNGVENRLARDLLERSASLVAAPIAALYREAGNPVTFVTEGSLFWHGWQFHDNVQGRLADLGVPADAVRFERIRDSAMKGALSLLTRTGN